MDYEIVLSALEKASTALDNIKTTAEDIYNEFNSSYLSKLSGTEIGSITSKIKEPVERIKKGTKNSATWLKSYSKELTQLENNLTSLNVSTLEKPTVFSKKFEDLFSKSMMPLLKTGANTKAKTMIGGDGQIYSLNENAGNNLRSISFNGNTFYIADTKIPLEQYAAYIQKNKMYQNAGFQGSQCMLLSQYYASDMLMGKFTRKNVMDSHGGAPAVKMNERCVSTNPQDVLEYAYNEINQGHPVVLQVSQKKSYLGWRHLVTMVGYTSDVKSAKDLTPDNILVLDCVDGKVQTLGQARAAGGHERRLFAQGGNYQALGPTEKFLATIASNG